MEGILKGSIVKLLENKCGEKLYSPGFPKKLKDDKPRRTGVEIKI